MDPWNTFISKYGRLILINGLLLAFLLLMLFIKPIYGLRKYSVYNHAGKTENAMLPVYGNVSLSQFFNSSDPADAFEILFSPANGEYHGSFLVRLSDAEGNLVEEWTTDKLDTVKGWTQFRMENGSIIAGEEYRLDIMAPDLDEFGAIGVAVFDSDSRASGAGDLIYDAADNTGDIHNGEVMNFGVYKRRFNIFAVLAIICVFGAVNICFVFKEKGVDKLALPILIASGLVMMLILAPGCGPDDIYHYYSSMVLSNKVLLRDNVNEIEKKYESDLPIHRNTNDALIETYEGLRYRVNGEEGTFIYEGKKDKLKWPLSHLAQALGITVGRVLKLGFIRVYALGRLFNLAAYIGLAFLAVRLVPVNKEMMLIMAILPMSMQQATQLSYDAPVNGIALVFTGYVFKILYEKRMFTWKDTLICSVLLVAISPLKVVYILLGFLLLLIPPLQFRSLIDRVLKIGVQAVSAVIALFITRGGDVSANVVRDSTGSLSGTGVHEIQNYNIFFAFDHPIRFAKLIVSNSEGQFSNMIKGMVGGSLAGFTLGIPEYLVLFLILGLLVCAVSDKRAVIETRWQTVIVLAMVVLGYYAILMIFAFAETGYGTSYIGGTQGRYLVPFLFPSMYCLCGRKFSISINRLTLFIPIAFIEIGYIVEVMSNIDF